MLCFYKFCLNMAAPPSKCIVVEGQAINLCLFSEDVKNLKFFWRRRRFIKILLSRGFLLFHDNARPYSAATAIEAMRRLIFGFSQIPDLAPTDYLMFGSLKGALRGQRFASDDKDKDALRTCL